MQPRNAIVTGASHGIGPYIARALAARHMNLRAIDKPRPEMVISAGPGRMLKALMDYFPGMGPALNRLSGADKLMASVADYRETARTSH